jgi:hypothetical protein
MTYSEPPEFVAQGDRVLVVGFARGRIIATNKPIEFIGRLMSQQPHHFTCPPISAKQIRARV